MLTNSYPKSLKPSAAKWSAIAMNNFSLQEIICTSVREFAYIDCQNHGEHKFDCFFRHHILTHWYGLYYLMQLSGSSSQLVLHLNLSQASHPTAQVYQKKYRQSQIDVDCTFFDRDWEILLGGVRANPLSRAWISGVHSSRVVNNARDRAKEQVAILYM